MRILQINKFLYAKGGAETYLLSLIELLKKNGQDVVCFSQKNGKNAPCPDEQYFIDDLDLSKFSLPSMLRLPRLFWSFKARRLVSALIKEKRPDIVHIHNIYHQISPAILPLFRQAGIPVVMTVHDFKLIVPDYTLRADGKKLPAGRNPLISLILKIEFAWHRWLDLYRRNIDLFIAPSQFVKNKLVENGFDAAKIKVLPHFLPDEFFAKPTAKPKNRTAEKYLFAYGRLDEGKGFDDLIAVFSEIRVSGLKLKIAGVGPDAARLQKQIDAAGLCGTVELIGHRTRAEIINLIRSAKAVINCSKLHETFGLTVLEAMALGKPVIAPKAGAIPELIADGMNGLLYQPGDAGDLKACLNRLLVDDKLRRKLSRNAKSVAKRYSAEAHYRELSAAYLSAIKGFKKPIRWISETFINIFAFAAFTVLFIIPFYRIRIENSLALSGYAKNYPQTANLYWKNPVALADAPELAKWDLIVLDMQAQSNSADTIKEIRRLNPNIIILAYASANEMPTTRLSAVEPAGLGLWHDLAAGDENAWHLKTYQGKDVVFWPGNVMMNLGIKDSSGKTYSQYLADFYSRKIMSSGLWDGLLFDNTWQTVYGVNKAIDIDGDGKADSADKINRQWHDNYAAFFSLLRQKLGPNIILLGNGDGDYSAALNGRMFEGFPEYWEGGWTGSIQRYAASEKSGFQPRLNIINSDTDNTGNQSDYRAMRYGLTSALLFNGFYSFDYGPNLREQLWRYDEYEANLGLPIGAAVNLLSSDQEIGPGLWQRKYANGLTLINSSSQYRTIALDGSYRKLSGSQDPQINNGSIADSVTLAPNDGIILIKTAQ